MRTWEEINFKNDETFNVLEGMDADGFIEVMKLMAKAAEKPEYLANAIRTLYEGRIPEDTNEMFRNLILLSYDKVEWMAIAEYYWSQARKNRDEE